MRLYGEESLPDYGRAIAVDVSRNVYVTGKSQGDQGFFDYVTVKYDSLGQQIWVERYRGPGNEHDAANDLVLDNSGNAYVTGFSHGGSAGQDFTTIKYVEFMCGDANADETVDLGDVVYLIGYLYKNGPAPDPPLAGDVNRDGIVDLGDVVYLISYLYKGGLPPCSD